MIHSKSWVVAVAAVVIGVAGSAQAQPQAKLTGYVDANFATTNPATGSFSDSASATLYGENATWSFDYQVPSLKNLDVAGGIFFTPQLGVGIAFANGSSEGNPSLTATLPHPIYYNSAATGTLAGTVPLKRTESGLHLQFVFKPRTPSNVQVRLFAGPSYFSAKQQLITDFRYSQVWLFSAQRVTIERYDQAEKSASAWGFNAGGDVGYFFTRNVGVGVVLRYAGASVDLPDTAAEIADQTKTQSVKVGGVTGGIGLRLRF